MSSKDYSDPAEEQKWLDEQEAAALEYLDRESVVHDGQLEVEWCVAPYVSVWSLPSRGTRSLRTWVICGDLPTDYVQDGLVSDARSAVRAFADRWTDVAGYLLKGTLHPNIQIGRGVAASGLKNLGNLLSSRAKLLLKWCEDESVW